jgi:hypothetical protein
MDNFMIENGWQENIYFKSYICIILHVHDSSLQYAVTYNTLQVVVYPTNNRYLGILRLRWGEGRGEGGRGEGGWDAHNISGFYAHCLGLNAAFYMCQI